MATASASTPYRQPKIHVGEVVLWRHNRVSPDPAPAIVTRVGQRAISVLILPPESRVGIDRDGVRHESDPELKTVISDSGVWDYTEGEKERQEFAAIVEALRAELSPIG